MGQSVRRLSLRIHIATKTHQKGKELSSVAYNDAAADDRRELHDLVFDHDRSNILTSSSHNQFLDASSHPQEAILIDHSLITGVEITLRVQGTNGLIWLLQIPHHHVSPLVHDLVIRPSYQLDSRKRSSHCADLPSLTHVRASGNGGSSLALAKQVQNGDVE